MYCMSVGDDVAMHAMEHIVCNNVYFIVNSNILHAQDNKIYTTFDTSDQRILLWYNLHISP